VDELRGVETPKYVHERAGVSLHQRGVNDYGIRLVNVAVDPSSRARDSEADSLPAAAIHDALEKVCSSTTPVAGREGITANPRPSCLLKGKAVRAVASICSPNLDEVSVYYSAKSDP